MKTKLTIQMILAVAAALKLSAVDTAPIAVFVQPDATPLWRTAPSATFDVPVSLPDGATAATLTVERRGYRRVYPGLVNGTQAVSLPPATSEKEESVYDLTLSFDDAAATVRSARLGVVRSAAAGGEATASVRTEGSSKGGNVAGSAVLPVPFGVEWLQVNGVNLDTGLGGAAGWYLFGPARPGTTYELETSEGHSASLRGISIGFSMAIK
jgi:hypothetical protein